MPKPLRPGVNIFVVETLMIYTKPYHLTNTAYNHNFLKKQGIPNQKSLLSLGLFQPDCFNLRVESKL